MVPFQALYIFIFGTISYKNSTWHWNLNGGTKDSPSVSNFDCPSSMTEIVTKIAIEQMWNKRLSHNLQSVFAFANLAPSRLLQGIKELVLFNSTMNLPLRVARRPAYDVQGSMIPWTTRSKFLLMSQGRFNVLTSLEGPLKWGNDFESVLPHSYLFTNRELCQDYVGEWLISMRAADGLNYKSIYGWMAIKINSYWPHPQFLLRIFEIIKMNNRW